ncbi:MAG: DNA polymerase III subunit delta' [Eggerthellaceae bacterium]|nr:DNA polymerase III subunit delta' [Eggerthellaceae bacterium]
MADSFERILGQPQVRRFLRAIVKGGRIGHAYLFTGPAGSNKTLAAYALAQAVICENGGCGECDACNRVMRRSHPDVRYFAPEGSATYLVSQIREVVADVDMAPIQAKSKVYIIDRADLLGVQAANAFLKTLEEPPEGVVIILLGRTRESVLPTIVSRCQVVPFRHIPVGEACGIVSQNTGVSRQRAAISIQACGGSITKAMEFAKSTERFEFRARVIEAMESLRLADDLDILEYASDLIERAKAPLDLVRSEQERELASSADLLAKSALRQIEQRHKRALSAKTVESLSQITAIVRSWLRDVLMICGGTPQLVINEDVRSGLEEAAAVTTAPRLANALRVVDETDTAIAYNVSPETCIDVLFLQTREALYGTHSTGNVAI